MFSEDFTVTPFSVKDVMTSTPQLSDHYALMLSNITIDKSSDFIDFTHCISLRFYNCEFTNIYAFIDTFEMVTELIFIKCTFLNTDSFDHLFTGKHLISVTFDCCDLSNIYTMRYMFENNNLLSHVRFSNCDTRNLISIRDMFHNCSSLESLDGLETFDVSNVEDMSFVFSNVFKLSDTFALKFWNVSKVTTLADTFATRGGLIDISPLR